MKSEILSKLLAIPMVIRWDCPRCGLEIETVIDGRPASVTGECSCGMTVETLLDWDWTTALEMVEDDDSTPT